MTAKKNSEQIADSNDGKRKRLANLEAHKFKPGQSGNPLGRPRKARTLISDAIRDKLAETYEGDLTRAEFIAERIVKEAETGLMAWLPAAKEALDRTEGKPAQAVNLNASIEYAADDKLEEIIAKAATRAAAGKASPDGRGKN